MMRDRIHIGVLLLVVALVLPLTGFLARQFHDHIDLPGLHSHAEHARVHGHAHDDEGHPDRHDHQPVRLFLALQALHSARPALEVCLEAPAFDRTAVVADGVSSALESALSPTGALPCPRSPFPPTVILLRRAADLPPPVMA